MVAGSAVALGRRCRSFLALRVRWGAEQGLSGTLLPARGPEHPCPDAAVDTPAELTYVAVDRDGKPVPVSGAGQRTQEV